MSLITYTGICPRCGHRWPLLPSGAVEPHPGSSHETRLPGGLCPGGGLLPDDEDGERQ